MVEAMSTRTYKLPINSVATLFARYCKCDRGVTAIEFVFVAPIMIAILLATLQAAVIFIAQSYLDNMAEDAMRTVLTNQAYALTQTQFKQTVCANITALFSCSNMIVDLEPAPSTASAIAAALPQFDAKGNLTKTTNFSVGTQNTKMILTLMYQWPVITGSAGGEIHQHGQRDISAGLDRSILQGTLPHLQRLRAIKWLTCSAPSPVAPEG